MTKLRASTLAAVLFGLMIGVWAQEKAPLALAQTILLPGLRERDLDHFGVDLPGHRLFLALEHDAAVGVFDLQTGKLVHTIPDVKQPHSFVYRADLKKLFVVDGGAGELKIYEGDSYKLIGSVELKMGADSNAFDPSTNCMFVGNGGKLENQSYSFISVVDTTSDKKLADIRIDADYVDTIVLEKSGPRLFFNIPTKNEVGVIDRAKRAVIATWQIEQLAKQNHTMAFDEARHRLFVTSDNPPTLIILDSDSGKVVSSLPSVSEVDDTNFDPGSKRIYVAGSEFVRVFQEIDADHYEQVGQVPSAYRAHTAVLVPELNRYYVAAPPHGDKAGAILVYDVLPSVTRF
jgi:DNA-binding beta-propeller fold protein YncE